MHRLYEWCFFNFQVYWVGPLLSALATSIGYKIFFCDKEEEDLEAVKPLRHTELPKV